MKSALSLVAFANNPKVSGIIALLEAALAALDDAGHQISAAYVDHALCQLREEAPGSFAGSAIN